MTTPISGFINGLRWNGKYWLAYGISSKIAKSYDGIKWTATTTNFSVVTDLKWNGNLWVAVGYIDNYGNGLIYYSSNGTIWTTATTDIATLGPTPITNWPLLVTEYNGSQWLAAGFFGNAFVLILTSPDGKNWQGKELIQGTGLQGIYLTYPATVIWNRVSWVLNAPFSHGGSIYSSTPLTQTRGTQFSYLVYQENIYLGTSVKGYTYPPQGGPPYLTGNQYLYLSSDLTTFTDITANTHLSSVAGIAYNGDNKIWLVYGINGVAINNNPTRTSLWTKTSLSFTPTDAKWFNSYWVVTNTGNTASSPDGLNWTTQTTTNLNNLSYNGEYYLSYTNNIVAKVTPWQKTISLHSPPAVNVLPPFKLKLISDPLKTTLTELTLEARYKGIRLLLKNIKNITTGLTLIKAESPISNYKITTTIFTISKNDTVFFGLIDLQEKKNGKWYSISYLKNMTYSI